ncbi:MAG: ABC transporter permease subunit, partial [Betaproteobacteria bacterium]
MSNVFAALLLLAAGAAAADEPLRVGSKRFTESYILGEVIAQAARDAGTQAEHKPGLGNTGIVFAALKTGSIDLYPEYTGTIAKEILKLAGDAGLAALNRALAPQGFGVAVPLGFNNSYALAMREDRARALAIRSLSDLARHRELRLGLSQEFIGRADGWPGLKAAYGLPFATPQGLDHGLAYEAVAAGKIDVMDIYTTDAKIERYRLRALEDDRRYFPRYDAVLLYRLDVPQRFPAAWRALGKLEGRIGEARMIRMNAAAELEGKSFAEAAALLDDKAKPVRAAQRGFWGALFGPDFWRLTGEHLLLVFASLAASVALGIPLGIAAAKVPRAAQPILGVVGVIQTIPSLALFAFLIALVGTIGTLPALIALFLYALLPIVRNTHAGLEGIGHGMRQAALALGLRARERLALIELPLALPSILAGVKTSAVINVGTATIAAFIGAGGYGERIASGLALNDNITL